MHIFIAASKKALNSLYKRHNRHCHILEQMKILTENNYQCILRNFEAADYLSMTSPPKSRSLFHVPPTII